MHWHASMRKKFAKISERFVSLPIAFILGVFSTVWAEIPQDIRLWVLNDRHIQRPDFHKYTKNYREEGNVQAFQLFKGDVSTEGRIHARLEVYGNEKFNPGNKWYIMQGTWKVKTEMKLICIAQLKDNVTENPQIMVHMNDGHRITFSPKGKGPTTLASEYKDKEFELKIRSNGLVEEVYFNGVKKYSGKPNHTSSGTKNYFRWGLYSNDKMSHDAYMTVTNAYIGAESEYKPSSVLAFNHGQGLSLRTLPDNRVEVSATTLRDTPLSLKLFDTSGRMLGSPSIRTLKSGNNQSIWRPFGDKSGPGQYFIVAEVAGKTAIHRMVLSR